MKLQYRESMETIAALITDDAANTGLTETILEELTLEKARTTLSYALGLIQALAESLDREYGLEPGTTIRHLALRAQLDAES